jgi:transglutaminase-like putative cysteine protease
MLRKSNFAILFCLLFLKSAPAQAVRHFTFHYAFTVKAVPAGQQVRVWLPLAESDPYQEVRVVSSKGDLNLKRTHESRFGNEMYYAESGKWKGGDLHFEVVYDVTRHEHLTLGVNRPRLANATLSGKESKEFLGPDKLVPVTGLPAEISARVTAGKTSVLEKARAIYEYVFDNMKYDKSGTGWGRGDVLYACDAKKGNCTDFHSLFIAMARSQRIPARFEIGFQLPADKDSGEIAGYHCWAEFFDPEHGWVPVDISEAWKNPVKKNYFFGAHDADRMQFTLGRDLELSPAQKGEPLNYFIYPYVEVNGKAYANISNGFSFSSQQQAAEGNEIHQVLGINN